MSIQFAWMTIPEFDDILMNFIRDRQIVDETGLKGQYNFALTIPSHVMQRPDANEGDRSAAFFRAVQTLGFQLDAKKIPLKVIVIDQLEKPIPN